MSATPPNHAHQLLLSLFIATTALQTGAPIFIQKLSRSIVYHDLLYGSMVLCALVGIGVALAQLVRQYFSMKALAAFYAALASLVAFDVWLEQLIAASC